MTSQIDTGAAQPIVVRIRVTPRDSINIVRLAKRRVSNMTDLSWLPGTAAGTFVLLSAGGLAYGGETGIAIGLVVLVVVGWTVAGTYPYWFSWITTRRYPDTFNREIVTRLEDDGLHAEFGASSSFRAWSDMSDFIEDGHYIVIRNPNRLPVAFVPKRCFDSEADLGRFRTLLAAHVKQALA